MASPGIPKTVQKRKKKEKKEGMKEKKNGRMPASRSEQRREYISPQEHTSHTCYQSKTRAKRTRKKKGKKERQRPKNKMEKRTEKKKKKEKIKGRKEVFTTRTKYLSSPSTKYVVK